MSSVPVYAEPARRATSPRISFLLALACGLCAANLYYAQPLAGPISAALGLTNQAAGLIVTLTQIGYGAGLLFIVPLSDLMENRRLILIMLGASALALVCEALSHHVGLYLVAAFFIGFTAVAVQILTPYAAQMAPAGTAGRAVGNVMAGTLLGIMLARPVSSLIAQLFSWQSVFLMSAGAMLLLAFVLGLALPPRMPALKLRYVELLASMVHLAKTTPVLQRRSAYTAAIGCAFSLFWTSVPLLLASPQFHLTQGGIGLFALAGVTGTVVAPVAGRLADRGWGARITVVAMLSASAAFLLVRLATGHSPLALLLLVAAAILIDLGVTANMAVGQRMILSLGAELRGRLNGLYMAAFFLGCALGSTLGAWAFARGGGNLLAWIGLAPATLALAYFLIAERKSL
jgi:predicted MFS family arabinose efflux permease